MKLWTLIERDLGDYKKMLNLIFSGIYSSHDLLVSSKIMISKTRSHKSSLWKSKYLINLPLRKLFIPGQNSSYLPKCFTNTL